MPLDDQPEWIRDLYRDIYPNAPIYPVGPRNNPATRVSGWRGGPLSQQIPIRGIGGQNNELMLGMQNELPPNINALGATGGLAPRNLNPTTTGSIIPPNWDTTVIPGNQPPTPQFGSDSGLPFGPMSRPPPPTNMTMMPPNANIQPPTTTPNISGTGIGSIIPDFINQLRIKNINRRGPGQSTNELGGVGWMMPNTNTRRQSVFDDFDPFNRLQGGEPTAFTRRQNNIVNPLDILRYLFSGRSQRDERFLP